MSARFTEYPARRSSTAWVRTCTRSAGHIPPSLGPDPFFMSTGLDDPSSWSTRSMTAVTPRSGSDNTTWIEVNGFSSSSGAGIRPERRSVASWATEPWIVSSL